MWVTRYSDTRLVGVCVPVRVVACAGWWVGTYVCVCFSVHK